MTFYQICHKPAHYIVTFYQIHHGWRTNSLVSMDKPIVSCLCGMNNSCWSHMPDWQRYKIFLDYWNIISCHLGGPHVRLASGWPTCYLGLFFLKQNSVTLAAHMSDWHQVGPHVSLGWIFLSEIQNAENGSPVTPWLSEDYTTRLLLQLCCCLSYHFFLLCSTVLIQSS
jgi:hypothetical protein